MGGFASTQEKGSNPVILSKGTCPFKRDDEKIEFHFF